MKALLTNRNLQWQLVKYGFYGSISALVMFAIIFYITFYYPAFVDQEKLTTEELVKNTNIINTIAFVPSCLVAYLTNRAFVFNAGRHSFWIEFSSFVVIATLSYLCGLLGTAFVIKTFQTSSLVGNLAFGIPSALVNFVCRKFFIFKN